MNNQQKEMERSGVLGGVASVLNAGGSAMVYAYDVTSGAFTKLFSVAKKAPVVPVKALGMVTGGLGITKPSQTRALEDKIRGYEKKIKGLYYEIGKEGSRFTDLESPLETETVKKLISEVREYEKEIQRVENRIIEIKEEKGKEALRKKERKTAAKLAEEAAKMTDEQVLKAVGSVIEKAVRQGVFETSSDRAIFDKVATDLLDSEMEIKTLAAAELGKTGNPAAVPILMEAAKFENADLTSEIINSLISVGDPGAITLFKEKVADSEHRVRIGCLRGLYKLASDEDAVPLLTDALRDDHPEVRRTAATFLGWKDSPDAVPALVQCLRDRETKVRKAAVSALANIKEESSVPSLFRVLGDKNLEIREKALDAIRGISGEEITFDVHASGKALTKAIDDLRNWWQEKRLGELEVTEVEEPDLEFEAAEEIEEPEGPAPEAEEEITEPVEFAAETAEEIEEPEGFAPEAAEEMAELEEAAFEAEEEIEKPEGFAAETAEEETVETQGPAPEPGLEIEEPEGFSLEDEEVAEEMAEPEVAPSEGEEVSELVAEEEIAPAEEPEPETDVTPSAKPQFAEEKLIRMVKSELLAICEDLGIDCDETLTKAQIVRLIVGENE